MLAHRIGGPLPVAPSDGDARRRSPTFASAPLSIRPPHQRDAGARPDGRRFRASANTSRQSLTSSFDNSGRPLVRTTPEGTYTAVYDLSGLKLSEVYAPAGGFTAKARTVSWVYDFAARLTSEGGK